MLIEYVRDKNNTKVGVVVAMSPDQIGWSRKNKKDGPFDKAFAVKVATGRALKSKIRDLRDQEIQAEKSRISLRASMEGHPDPTLGMPDSTRPKVPSDIQPILEKMKDRARRFFKPASETVETTV